MQAPIQRTLDVSIVMPVYNRSALIARALDSIRNQACLPQELIVVDDASTDDTVQQVQAWSERTGFPVILEKMPKNGGPAAARNRGIEIAKTSMVAFLDSDDEHLPGALEKLAQALESHPDAVVAFGDATKITPTRRDPHAMFQPRINASELLEPTRQGDITWWLRDAKSALLAASFIPTCSACFRRTDALAVGGMPTAYRAGEDWLFWLKLSERGRFICYLEDFSVVHRHASNITHPNHAVDASRQKIIGFLALLDGTAGITLTDTQRAKVSAFMQERVRVLRYQASRLGLRNYFQQMRNIPGYSTTDFLADAVRHPKSLLRATVATWRPLAPIPE